MAAQGGIIRLAALAFAPAILIGGCATAPVATVGSLAAGIPPPARTFAVIPPADENSRAAVPAVEERLRRFGYEPSATPDLLVEVSASERPRNVGAFMPDGCGSSAWTAEPRRKWLVGGGEVLTLRVRLLDARTNAPVHQASASVRTSGSVASRAADLAEAAVPADPREAPRAETGC